MTDATHPPGPRVPKSLDTKLARIQSDSSCRDFIIADAKDADMAFGLSAPGHSPEYYGPEARFRTLNEYRQLMREIVHQGLVDIMLMSASSSEVLTLQERLFDNSRVTPAIRANDTTDIWLAAGSGRYASQPSRPFRSATIDHAQCGKVECAPHERRLGANLGLYSITLNNDVQLDLQTLEAYKTFRLEAERKDFRHFLEVFDPNASGAHSPADLARFINDHIAHLLAGVTQRSRPLFLKIVYHGPAAMEALSRYDDALVVGILGGSAGTTFDAYHMLWEAKKYGARVALYGRKINNAEHQLSFVKYLRRGGRPTQAGGSRACLSWRSAAAEDSAAPITAGRPAIDRDVGQLCGNVGTANHGRLVSQRCRGTRFWEDDAGGKSAMEPRTLEADSGLNMEKLIDCVLCGSCVVDMLVRPVPLEVPIGGGRLMQTDPIEVTTGGIVANAGIAMARLRMQVAALSYVGRDDWANLIRKRLSDEGVDVRSLITHPTGATSTTAVLVDDSGERSFAHCVGAPKLMTKATFLENLEFFALSRMMLVGYYSLMPNLEGDLPEVFAAIRETGCQTALDAAGDGGSLQPLDRILPHLDVYCPSRAEAEHQTGQTDPQKILETFRSCGAPGLLGVKLGSQGALLSPAADQFIAVPAVIPPGPIVDTTGAGDAFYAGLLCGLLKGFPPAQAGQLAAAVGACCVTGLGASAGLCSYEETIQIAGL